MIMRATSSWMTIAGVVLLWTTGCSGASGPRNDRAARGPVVPESDPVPDPPPPIDLCDGSSGETTCNGLMPATYHDHAAQIAELMSHPLSDVADPGWLKNPPLPQQYETSLVLGDRIDTEGQNYRLLADTIGCALGAGQYWYAGDDSIKPGVTSNTQGLNLTRLFEGEGLMKGTQTWTNKALEWEQARDVYTCLVTRLNAYGHFVRIWLGGNDMASKPGAAGLTYPGGPFSYEEALWLALPLPVKGTLPVPVKGALSVYEGVKFYAWPLKNLEQSCPSLTYDALKWRVCGTLWGTAASGGSLDYVNGCDVTVDPVDWDTCEKDGNCPCVRSTSGSWTCTIPGGGSYPVIETRLSPQDWPKIYQRPPHRAPTSPWCKAPPIDPLIKPTTPKPAGP